MALGTWLRETAGTYVGNATTVRDFRVQLRGNRSVVLWSIYLIALIGFGMMIYANTASHGQINIVQAQNELRQFYNSVMIMLAVMVNTVAPALTATAVVTERQRRSLDLVFSAPVSPRYYLTGKMISSYRYVWMMLILSLPVTSACVVLGGATWSDVVAAYILLSMHGLIFTAIALVLSTLSNKPVAAIVWSYLAAGCYSIFSVTIAGMSGIGGFMRGTLEMPFVFGINPYIVTQAAPTYTEIWGKHVPNWVLVGIFALMFSRLMMLGASSILSSYGAREIRSLRIHGLLYTALLMYSIPFLVSGAAPITSSSTISIHSIAAAVLGWAFLVPLLILLPFLTCYGSEAERKFWPDGTFKFRNAIKGTPSGALPYLLMFLGAGVLGTMIGFYVKLAALPTKEFWAITAYLFALWFFIWSLGRLSSSWNMGVRSARTLHFSLAIAVLALPVPFLSILSNNNGIYNPKVWELYVLRPLAGYDNATRPLVWTFILTVLGALITVWAESTAKKKVLMRPVEA